MEQELKGKTIKYMEAACLIEELMIIAGMGLVAGALFVRLVC